MRTKLQVFGTGCPKCNLLTERTERAATELALDYELEKVTDINRIVELGVVATPALAVNGEIKVFGHVPTTTRIKEMLSGTAASEIC